VAKCKRGPKHGGGEKEYLNLKGKKKKKKKKGAREGMSSLGENLARRDTSRKGEKKLWVKKGGEKGDASLLG